MRSAPGRRLAKLLRIMRRKDMEIAKLKRKLEECRMEQTNNKKRKAVITLMEGRHGSVDVAIEFSSRVGDAGACAALGMAGFAAVVNAVNRARKEGAGHA
ncbi:MAG: hypothetical protein ACI33N_03340 [Desulfovibrionaceae bacterium]